MEACHMAIRKIVKIDEALCNGCGVCIPACAEGAIELIDGKARLVSDKLCDGLGACLGECPEGAITVEEREAESFDQVAVEARLVRLPERTAAETVTSGRPVPHHAHAGAGCPGSRVLQFGERSVGDAAPFRGQSPAPASALRQWPLKLHLVPPTAPYFRGADILLAADCTAFAAGNFHAEYLHDRSLAIACPKLDHGQEIYLEKLRAMIDHARINTLTVLIMQVPCCSGLLLLAKEAVASASRKVPIKSIVIGMQGEVLREEWC